MLIELYNEAGQLVLDTQTHILKCIHKRMLPGGTTIRFVSGDLPEGTWRTFWEISGRDAQNKYITIYEGPIYVTNTPVESQETWVRPLNGTTVCRSGSFTGVAVSSGKVMGGGVEYAFTTKAASSDASGYLDCYAEDGRLLWSLASLLKVPQILKVVNSATVSSISLLEFDAAIREKIFFYTTYAGRYIVLEESVQYEYMVFTRVGDIVYFKGNDNRTVTAQVFAAYIPDP